MAELLAGALSGAGCTGKEKEDKGNGVFFQAFNIAALLPYEEFHPDRAGADRVGQIGAAKARRRRGPLPRRAGGTVPPSSAAREGIPVEESIWQEMLETADSLGVTIQ